MKCERETWNNMDMKQYKLFKINGIIFIVWIINLQQPIRKNAMGQAVQRIEFIVYTKPK